MSTATVSTATRSPATISSDTPAGAESPDDDRWRAVLDRDAGADGRFVYAVHTTGIYCRPTCPSRRPRRAVVEFFPGPNPAEQAGFRACKRCRPNAHDGVGTSIDQIRLACAALHAHIGAPLALHDLAALTGISPRRLQRTFKRVVGITPRQYADACRLSRFKALVKNEQGVTEALYDAGYNSSSRLYESAGERLGMTPDRYRRGAPGVTLRYATTTSPLGTVLLGATDRGIAAVYLGDSAAALLRELHREFPSAAVSHDGDALQPWLELIVRHLAGQVPSLELPLDVRATAFQRQVWQELRRIPLGQTRTYRELARAIGRPSAARAVGQACARNPVSLTVPCHRAVREDGGLGGYRWGVGRKQKLLARERRTTA